MILRKQFLAHVAQTSPSPMLVEVARAEGSFFYTPEGKRYFDLVAGVSVSNVGHGNPAVVRAVSGMAGHAPVSSMYTTAAPVTSCVRYAVFPPGVSSRSIFSTRKPESCSPTPGSAALRRTEKPLPTVNTNTISSSHTIFRDSFFIGACPLLRNIVLQRKYMRGKFRI